MQIGRRLIYDKSSGKIIYDMGEDNGAVIPRETYGEFGYIDLEYGQYNDYFSRLKDGLNSIKVINTETKELEFDLLEPIQTPEERIAELENQLLIAEGVI